MILKTNNAFVQNINALWLSNNKVVLDVLRLDKLHDVVSGNKWFKLQYYLQDAADKGFTTLATFGGAYSNHIAATAYAAKQHGFASIGIIRGEKPLRLSHTLLQAQQHNMQLIFVSRNAYNDKKACMQKLPHAYYISEGGYGDCGACGAAEILNIADEAHLYTHIVCAVGTGTTLAGLIQAAKPQQKIIGISVMKNNTALHQQVDALLHTQEHAGFSILHEYHFGGYAKRNNELIDYMNQLWLQHQLPTDFVYTAKAFYAVEDLIKTHYISQNSKVLFIHTGGLQGNFSLPAGTLVY